MQHHRVNPQVLLIMALLVAGTAVAHDEWLQPSAFHVAPGGHLDVNVMVGETFTGEAVRRRNEKTEQFQAVGPNGVQDLSLTELKIPYAHVELADSGSYVIDFVDKYQLIQFPPKKFQDYLQEKGLDNVIQTRGERALTRQAGREAFSHYLKMLITVGEAENRDRRLGLKFEIVAEPALIHTTGSHGRFQVLFDDKPIAHILVTATNHTTPDRVFSARTDATGHVNFALNSKGQWLIHAVHMLPESNIPDVDWRSFWTSLTFDLN